MFISEAAESIVQWQSVNLTWQCPVSSPTQKSKATLSKKLCGSTLVIQCVRNMRTMV